MLTEIKTDVLLEFVGIEDDFYKITEIALDAQAKEQQKQWVICCAASLIVGNFDEGATIAFAGRLGVSVDTVQFYAKAWRVRNYVKGERVSCSYGHNGFVDSTEVLQNLTMTHYGMIHRKVFKSERTETGMEYEPVMEPKEVLSWLAECIEPLASEGKRLSPQALMELMKNNPDNQQWWEAWGTWKNRLQDFLLQWSEKMPEGLRKALAELIRQEWE